MAAGKGGIEKMRRIARTMYFMVAMVASLLVMSLPLLVAIGDIMVPCLLISSFTCVSCHSFNEHLHRYAFKTSLTDIPLVSVIRSLLITCVYSMCDGPALSHGPYLGTVALSSFVSILLLSVKACVFSVNSQIEAEASSSLSKQKLHLKKSWGMPVLFLSSVVFALGHIVIAYRTSCRARRKLLFHRVDPESVLSCKIAFSGYQKVPRSPTPIAGKTLRCDSEMKRKPAGITRDEGELPVRLLADIDSLFMACQGITLHYKLSLSGTMDDFAYQWPYTNMTQPRGAEIDRLEKLSALSAQIETLSRTFEAFEAQRRQSVAVTCDYCAGNHMSHQCAIGCEPVQYSGDYPNSYVYPNNYHQDWGYHPDFSWSNNQDQLYAPSPTYPPDFSCPPPLQQEEHSNFEEVLEKFIRASDKRNEEQDKKINQIELTLQSQGASLKNLENQLGQIAHALNNHPQYTWLYDMDDETDGEPKPNLQPDVPYDIDVEREERLGDQQKEIGKDLTVRFNEDEPISLVSHVPSPPKLKNPGSFAKPCPIGSHVVGKALGDVRASTVVEPWWDEKEKIEEDSIMFIKLQCPILIIDIMEETPSGLPYLMGILSTKSMLGDFNSRVFANGNLPKAILFPMDGGFLNFRRGIG